MEDRFKHLPMKQDGHWYFITRLPVSVIATIQHLCTCSIYFHKMTPAEFITYYLDWEIPLFAL